MKTKTIVRLSFLLAIAVVVSYLESLIPLPFFGVKLGFANAVGLLVLYYYNGKVYVGFGLLRVLLSALLWTGFGSAFLISLSGMLLASITTLIVRQTKTCSIYGISIIGAIFHGLGQVLMVAVIYQTIYIISYVLVLTSAGLATGVLTALVTVLIIKRLPEKTMRN